MQLVLANIVGYLQRLQAFLNRVGPWYLQWLLGVGWNGALVGQRLRGDDADQGNDSSDIGTTPRTRMCVWGLRLKNRTDTYFLMVYICFLKPLENSDRALRLTY